ncbi:MAG: ABC transporter permease subunit [Oscillospiraceae bacterium]|nr:ABC transporter permease subunit [Oscillospiraceae bacterium]
MTILKHEMRQGRNSLIIWTAVIAFMLGVCILIYPEMSKHMDGIGEAFANMGGFSAAFGMDKINFGEFIGFFGVECGNVLGLGGAFFAALTGISALFKEEREHTAEFLLTHPVSRQSVIAQKLFSVIVQIIILNAASVGVTALSAIIIGESPETKPIALMFAAYLIMQIEIAAICFGLSAFIGRGGLGLGLGLAAAFYFLNIIANLTESAEFLKYITPFGYTDSADIIADGQIEIKYLAVGIVMTVIGIGAAFWKYGQKDIS